MDGRVLLPVRRFKQRPSECSIASAASLANYYDNNIDYSQVRKLIAPEIRSEGLYTSQQARLLNQLGFKKVSIVTARVVDFSWTSLSKPSLINKLKRLRAYYGRIQDEDKSYVDDLIKWLEAEGCDNRLIIDYDYSKYIKRSLDNNKPVCVSINWTSIFKVKKSRVSKVSGDINGMSDEHAIVLRGYDSHGVFVVDSHHKFYKGKLSKYNNGYYKLSWEQFLVNIPGGDLLLVN